MSVRPFIYLLSLLLSIPFLALGQAPTKAKPATLTNTFTDKTFMIGEDSATSEASKDLHLFFVFFKDGKAVFRVKKGNTILKDNPISWQFSGDSLSLQAGQISLEAEGKTQLLSRPPILYFVRKVSGGYLLKGRQDEMLFLEQP